MRYDKNNEIQCSPPESIDMSTYNGRVVIYREAYGWYVRLPKKYERANGYVENGVVFQKRGIK